MPQPPGDYGPLLYPTNTEGTAGLTLDFTVHPVGRRATEYAYDGGNSMARISECFWNPLFCTLIYLQRKRIYQTL